MSPVSILGQKGIMAGLAALILAIAALARGIGQKSRDRAAAKREEAAYNAEMAARLQAAKERAEARREHAASEYVRETERVSDMPDAAVDADALARVERDRTERKGLFNGPKRGG